MSGGQVIGWTLDRVERAVLLTRFPPAFRNVVADHVTLKSGAGKNARLPPRRVAEIVGRAVGDGVEAMVARIEGSCDRPGGGIFHIT